MKEKIKTFKVKTNVQEPRFVNVTIDADDWDRVKRHKWRAVYNPITKSFDIVTDIAQEDVKNEINDCI